MGASAWGNPHWLPSKKTAMHELSIAMSILESVQEEVDQRQCGTVEAIHIRIGDMSGVVPGALRFAYEVAVQETPFASSRLIIETAAGHELEIFALELPA